MSIIASDKALCIYYLRYVQLGYCCVNILTFDTILSISLHNNKIQYLYSYCGFHMDKKTSYKLLQYGFDPR